MCSGVTAGTAQLGERGRGLKVRTLAACRSAIPSKMLHARSSGRERRATLGHYCESNKCSKGQGQQSTPATCSGTYGSTAAGVLVWRLLPGVSVLPRPIDRNYVTRLGGAVRHRRGPAAASE